MNRVGGAIWVPIVSTHDNCMANADCLTAALPRKVRPEKPTKTAAPCSAANAQGRERSLRMEHPRMPRAGTSVNVPPWQIVCRMPPCSVRAGIIRWTVRTVGSTEPDSRKPEERRELRHAQVVELADTGDLKSPGR